MKWKREPLITKPPVLKPMGWEPVSSVRCGRFIVKCLLLLLIVSLIFVLSACSRAVSITPTPAPPANLASDCPSIPAMPSPFLDPDRIIWEMSILTAYADCAAKHRLSIDAWESAINQD